MLNFLQSELFQKVRKVLPAASFFGGFTWDSITLGKLVQTSDLAILLLYYLASLVFLILLAAEPGKFLNRSWSEAWQNRFTYAVQFCFGSLFSALVVCYFKSSASVGAFFLSEESGTKTGGIHTGVPEGGVRRCSGRMCGRIRGF